MSLVLRRFNDPTRWVGVPIGTWFGGGGAVGLLALAFYIIKPPFMLAVGFTMWVIFLPSGLVLLWAAVTGVPLLLLVSDFLRFLLRRRRVLQHVSRSHLKGGIYVRDMPAVVTYDQPAWTSDVEIPEPNQDAR
ncbi:MAG: hypothetical protein Q7T55_06420 [Solirubrobacteraceae bacterium]|nr:hypothetical protein [Solirubrobacteraceae bacterium]